MAVDAGLNLAVVAAGAGGLHIVDVTDPTLPKLVRTIPMTASQVEVVRGVTYVAFGAQIWAYDLRTGNLLTTLALGSANIVALANEGLFLYSIDANRVLRAIDITDAGSMLARGSMTLPAAGMKLVVGNGIAYVAAGVDSSF